MDVATEPTQEIVDRFVGVCHGNLDQVRTLLDQYPSLINAASALKETGVQAAAHVGNRAIVEFLLSRGAPMDVTVAAMLGKKDEVARMLDEDPSRAHATGAHAIPAIFFASLSGDTEIAGMLHERGADLNAGDGVNTPLHGAAAFGHAEMVRWLLARGARTDTKDYNGKIPADAAEGYGRPEMAALIRAAESPSAAAAG